MARSEAARKPLDETGFLSKIKARLDQGDGLSAAVRHVLARYDIAPELLQTYTEDGALQRAMEVFNSLPRGRILQTVTARREYERSHPGSSVIQVRCELRDWPVWTAAGQSTVDAATPDEIHAQRTQMRATADGILRRERVLARLEEKARAAGVAKCGELSDEDLAECLEGDES